MPEKSTLEPNQQHRNQQLTPNEVRQVRYLYKRGFSSVVIARYMRLGRMAVEDIVKGRTYQNISEE